MYVLEVGFVCASQSHSVSMCGKASVWCGVRLCSVYTLFVMRVFHARKVSQRQGIGVYASVCVLSWA